MGVRRYMRRLFRGVEDLIPGHEAFPEAERREAVYNTIDDAPFQYWVVFVAGTGFLVDAYTLFALNVVIPMLGYVYFPEEGKVPRGYQTAMFCATLAGSMIGQVAFGVAADMYGRRRVYGIELMVLIAGSLYLSMSGTGERHSMNIWGWLVTWRLIVGLAVGADYPLSAVITSEFAPRKHRARMLTTVFFFQAVGQTIAQALSIAFIAAWQSRIEKNKPTCQDDDCIRAIDSLWRLVIGLGAVPAAVALAFRYAIPESPRYQMDVLRAVDLTLDDITDYFGVEDYDGNPEGGGGPAVRPSGDQPRAEYTDNPAVGHGGAAAADADTDAAHAAHTTPFDAQISDTTGTVSPAEEMARWRANASRTYTPDDIHLGRLGSSEGRSTANLTMGGRDGDNEADAMAAEAVSRTGHRYSPVQDEAGPEATGPVRQAHNHPPLASKQDAYRFFILERNWIYLAGTSLAWFFLDFAFYGLGYASPTIIRSIWEQPGRELSVYQELLNNSIHSLIVVSIGAVAGGLIIIKMIKHVSPKTIQFWGFLILAVLFVVTGSIWNVVLSNDGTGNNTAILVLYVFIQLFFNMGPNTTTFMIPAEIFPTRYRCTCHGVSAAAGKLASWSAQLFLTFAFHDRASTQRQSFGHVLQVMCGFMVAGAIVTYFMVPQTRDAAGKSRTLEDLAKGRRELSRAEGMS